MKKQWKYRACCAAAALLLAGVQPMAALADVGNEAAQGAWETDGGAGESAGEAVGQDAALAAWEAQLDSYFDGAVLVGDSVMLGFRNYAMRKSDTWLGRLQFLAAGSFSAYNALQPVTEKSVHPVYQGQKRLVWESLQMMGAKKVFLFFGLNDVNIGTLEQACARYKQVADNIKETCPEAEIHLISMTYTLAGKGKGNLQNDKIRQYNAMLSQMALENGWGFVELADRLADANGDLAAVYCSDHYVHQTNAAYDVWCGVLREYAGKQLTGTCAYPVGEAALAGMDGQDGQGGEDGQDGGKPSGPAGEIAD